MVSNFSITVPSYPKVNLALDILGKDKSGYHEIRTVFHELSAPEYSNLHDELILEPRGDRKIIVESDNPKLPCDKTNTVYRAAVLLKRRAPRSSGVRVFIKKRIPLMSGFGGGASNAVAALKGLAMLWNLECCTSENCIHAASCFLASLALQIGMDCPFFWHGGTALGEHFGEKITPLPPLPASIKFEVKNTGVEISSKWAYENIDLSLCGKNADKTEKLIAAIRAGDAGKILENLHNDFEEVEAWHESVMVRQAHHDTVYKIMLCGSGGARVKISLIP